MVLDYGIYFSKVTSVCLLDGIMIVSNRTKFLNIKIKPKVSLNHMIIHKNIDETGTNEKQSLLYKIAANPLKILKLKGNKKLNLKSYVAFITKGKFLPSMIRGNKIQKKILNLIGKNPREWASLLRTDIVGYKKLKSVLNVKDDFNKFSDESFQSLEEELKQMGEQYIFDRNKIYELIMKNKLKIGELLYELKIHYDFCCQNKTNAYNFKEEYTKMVQTLSDNRINKLSPKCAIDHIHYPEVNLYNQFIESFEMLETFDKKSLNFDNYTTVSERGIKDYILFYLEMHTIK